MCELFLHAGKAISILIEFAQTEIHMLSEARASSFGKICRVKMQNCGVFALFNDPQLLNAQIGSEEHFFLFLKKS